MAFLNERGIPLLKLHTLGHAGLDDMRCVAAALCPRRIVPMHTEASPRFCDYFSGVELHPDGGWWEA